MVTVVWVPITFTYCCPGNTRQWHICCKLCSMTFNLHPSLYRYSKWACVCTWRTVVSSVEIPSSPVLWKQLTFRCALWNLQWDRCVDDPSFFYKDSSCVEVNPSFTQKTKCEPQEKWRLHGLVSCLCTDVIRSHTLVCTFVLPFVSDPDSDIIVYPRGFDVVVCLFIYFTINYDFYKLVKQASSFTTVPVRFSVRSHCRAWRHTASFQLLT